MLDLISIAFDVATSNPETALGIRVLLDGAVVHENSHVSETYTVQHSMGDNDGEHVLCFELFGKLPTHTRINDAGEIVSDAVISISNILFDEIDCSKIVTAHAVYKHDFNGSGNATQDKFFGDMGCNGIVELKFTTPIYIWLLEHM
jgi:hypothetical protein